MATRTVEAQTEAAAAPGLPAAAPGTAAPGRRPRVFRGWYLVGSAFVAMFVSAGAQAYVVGAFFTPMTDELGWTRAEFLYGQTVGQFFTAFVGFFIGAYIDRWGARVLMLTGVTILGVGLFLMSEVQELWQWVLLRGLLSTLGTALLGNLAVNVTLAKWFVEQRGRVIGLASIGVSLAGIVLPPLMTWYVDEFGWRMGWRAIAIGAWVLAYPTAILMLRQPEDVGLHPDGKTDEEMAGGGGAAALADFANSFTRAQAIRTSTIWVLMIAFGLGSLGLITMIVITIPYLTDSGFSRGTAAWMVTVLAIPAAVSKPIWGYMGDRWSERLSTSLSFAMNAVAMLIIIGATQAGSVAALSVGYFVVGWGIGGQIPLQEGIWATYFGRRYLGSVRSVAMPFTVMMGATGPIGVAAYYDAFGDYDGAMLGVALAWAAAATLILFVRRPRHPGRGAEPAPLAAPPVPAPLPGAAGQGVNGDGARPGPAILSAAPAVEVGPLGERRRRQRAGLAGGPGRSDG